MRPGQVIPTIPFLELEWEEGGPEDDPRARLLATINVGGVMLHLEACEMVRDHENVQQFAAYADSMSQCFDAFGVDGAWDVLLINGRKYALLASPFCNGVEVDPR